MRRRAAEHIAGLREWAGDEVADDAIEEIDDDLTHYMRATSESRQRVNQLEAELATAQRRIEHLTARMRYWRTQATGYPDSRQQREARRKG